VPRGFNIKVPLSVTSTDGPYVVTKKYNENAKQNFKMIILTEKGEKISDNNFGCGLKRFLFEPSTMELSSEIESEIRGQVAFYAPYIDIDELSVISNDESQTLQVLIGYTISTTSTTVQDVFEVTK